MSIRARQQSHRFKGRIAISSFSVQLSLFQREIEFTAFLCTNNLDGVLPSDAIRLIKNAMNGRNVLLPSLFMLAWKHLCSLQALHWFRWVLSTGQRPFMSPVALQVYTLFLWMLLLKKPEHPKPPLSTLQTSEPFNYSINLPSQL